MGCTEKIASFQKGRDACRDHYKREKLGGRQMKMHNTELTGGAMSW